MDESFFFLGFWTDMKLKDLLANPIDWEEGIVWYGTQKNSTVHRLATVPSFSSKSEKITPFGGKPSTSGSGQEIR
jgi:hypothetical protein